MKNLVNKYKLNYLYVEHTYLPAIFFIKVEIVFQFWRNMKCFGIYFILKIKNFL
ncbi:MAG: hypothetical protein GAK29_02514 [Acinetobacter bereziniae]|uniref:Uncharacterized protein n=1 Tax=Acinetobacter bereziniae TaxID=106648 RepID=A0A833PEV6_ACIBZ|nr:MAG: hypothetical protein GAK29_02514 [Acinetobacter bereziniae]